MLLFSAFFQLLCKNKISIQRLDKLDYVFVHNESIQKYILRIEFALTKSYF